MVNDIIRGQRREMEQNTPDQKTAKLFPPVNLKGQSCIEPQMNSNKHQKIVYCIIFYIHLLYSDCLSITQVKGEEKKMKLNYLNCLKVIKQKIKNRCKEK